MPANKDPMADAWTWLYVGHFQAFLDGSPHGRRGMRELICEMSPAARDRDPADSEIAALQRLVRPVRRW